MLNYTRALRTGYGTTYGYARSGVIWLSNVDCQGNETNLGQCSFPGWGVNDCYHYYDVNVICDSKSPNNKSVAIVQSVMPWVISQAFIFTKN